jgi:ABC-2 type transport system ATP-binding protein
MPAIALENIRHDYKPRHFWQRTRTALAGLDLTVEPGQTFGYLGANGAGKTTTIKILAGLQRPSSGRASLFDVSVESPESRRRLGFMPENPYFYEYLTARETLSFYAALCGLSRRDRTARGNELLEFVGPADAADVRVGDFSKGMRQRLGIAQAIVHRPPLIILDEPMSGLDPSGRRQVREAMLELRRAGSTLFFSSHILSDVEMICDRVALLDRGRLLAVGSVPELVERRVRAVEGGAENRPAELAARLSERASSTLREGAETVFTFPDWAAADAAVDKVRNAGGAAHLSLVRPVHESLEDYFMRKTGAARAEVGAWSGGADK